MTLSKYRKSVLDAITKNEANDLSVYAPQVQQAIGKNATYDPSYDVSFDIPQVKTPQSNPIQEVKPFTSVSPISEQTDFTGGYTNPIKPIEQITNNAPQPLKQPINDFVPTPTQEITTQVAKPVETVQNQPFYQSGEINFEPQLKDVKGAIDTVDEATYLLERAGNTLSTMVNKIPQFLGSLGLKKDIAPVTNTEDQLAKLKALGIDTDALPDDYKKSLVETTNLPQTEKFWQDVITYEFVKDRALDIEQQYKGKIDDFTKLAGDVSSGVLDMLPQTAMAYFTGGTSAMAYVFADSASRATKNAVQLGADAEQAQAYGVLMGAIEVGTEMIAGGWAGVPSGKFTGLAKEGLLGTFEKATLKLAKTDLGKKVISMAYQYLGEGAEEYLSEILGNYANSVIGQEVKSLGAVQEDALYAGLVGTLSAVVGDLQRIATVKISQKVAQDKVLSVEDLPKEKQLEYVNELMDKTGTKVVVADTYNGQDISNSSGAYDPQTKTVIIPTQAYENENILTLSAVHEFTHSLETSGQYQALQDSIVDFMKQNGTYDFAVADIVKRYGAKVDINSEIVSDFLQDTMFKRVKKTENGFETFTDALVLNSFLKNTKGKNILQKGFGAFLNSHYAGELTTKYDDLMKQFREAQKNGDLELAKSLEPQLAEVFGQLNLTDKAQYFKGLELAFNSAIDFVGEVEPKEDLQFAKKDNRFSEPTPEELTRDRKFPQSVAQSGAVSEETSQGILNDLSTGKYTYEVSGDKKALDYADKKLQEGSEKVFTEMKALYDNDRAMTKKDITVMEKLLVEFSKNKQDAKVVELLGMISEIGTTLGQSVQALSLIRKMTPQGQLMVMDRQLNRLSESYRDTKLEQRTDYTIPEVKTSQNEAKQAISEFMEVKDQVNNITVDNVAEIQKSINKIAKKRSVDNSAVLIDQELVKSLKEQTTEEGQQQALELIKKDAKKKLDKVIKSLGKLENTYKGKKIDLTIDPTLREELLNSKSQEETDDVIDRIKADIATRLPATLGDKINAWRMLSMLGNPKTHIRNVVSNTVFGQVAKVKDTVAYAIEQGFIKPEDRTKALKVNKNIKNFAKDIFNDRVDEITQGGKYDMIHDIESRKKIFDTKLIEGAKNLNSNMLENEDIFAMRGAFTNVLSQFMTAKGYDPKTITQSQLDNAVKYATEQAKVRTFRQYSSWASTLNRIQKTNPFTEILMGSLLPFKKTPLNILKTGFEYSPAGLAVNLTYGLAQVRKGVENGGWSTTQFVDKISAGLTGSAIAAIGYAMFTQGLISVGEDDKKSKKENKFGTNLGEQRYSLKLGDWSVSLDWLAPGVMPLMVGAEMAKFTQEEKNVNLLDAGAEAMANIFNPAFDLTMLQGVSETFKSFESAGANQVGDILTTMAANYATQFFPTMMAQAAKTVDPTSRTTYAGGDLSGTLETTINKIKNKIPFASMTNEPVINVKGEEVKQDGEVWVRGLQNFLNPANIKQNITDDTDKEIFKVFKDTGETSVIPSTAPSSFTYDGQTIELSGEDKTRYAKTLGNTTYNSLKEVFSSDLYNELPSDLKANVIADAIAFASNVAKSEFMGLDGKSYINTKLQKMNEAEIYGVSLAEYLIIDNKLSTIKTTEDFSIKDQFIADLVYKGYTDDEIYRYLVYVGDYSYTKSDQKYIDLLRSAE